MKHGNIEVRWARWHSILDTVVISSCPWGRKLRTSHDCW